MEKRDQNHHEDHTDNTSTDNTSDTDNTNNFSNNQKYQPNTLLKLGQILVLSIAFQFIIGAIFGIETLVVLGLITVIALFFFTKTRAITQPQEPASHDPEKASTSS